MTISYLAFTIRFLQTEWHGRGDAGEPEWPPSPLRFFQSLVAAAAARSNERMRIDTAAPALRWLERQSFPFIDADTGEIATAVRRHYVPDNVGDKVASSWSKGGDSSMADYRTEKDVRPIRLAGERAVRYLYPLKEDDAEFASHRETLCSAARSMTHLGWGVDMVVANAAVVSDPGEQGERWRPVDDDAPVVLRVPIEGTLDDLSAKHAAFLNRITRDDRGEESFQPVPPPRMFRSVGYRRADDPVRRPFAVFQMRRDDGSFFAYPQERFVHIAGMVRHLAIQLMKSHPPEEKGADWVDAFVAGHGEGAVGALPRFSYLPLPSIGHKHVDPSVRRILIVAPPGDKRLLDHLIARLTGELLVPTQNTKLDRPTVLAPASASDSVARRYLVPSRFWASVTPVILPGHDDHKPAKTRKLIEKALQQSGIVQPCEYEWSAFSWFPGSLSAHKYGRDKRPTGYIRPDHLISQTGVHLKLFFKESLKIPGPLVIGAGRHCGFGLMASLHE